MLEDTEDLFHEEGLLLVIELVELCEDVGGHIVPQHILGVDGFLLGLVDGLAEIPLEPLLPR